MTDPPNGRVPALTAEAAGKRAALIESRAGVNRHEPTPGGFVDDLGPGRYAVRCLVGFNTGPPMIPGTYNQNVQVFQTEDTVVLFNEMIHDARVVPIDGRDRLDAEIRQWLGKRVYERVNLLPWVRMDAAVDHSLRHFFTTSLAVRLHTTR